MKDKAQYKVQVVLIFTLLVLLPVDNLDYHCLPVIAPTKSESNQFKFDVKDAVVVSDAFSR